VEGFATMRGPIVIALLALVGGACAQNDDVPSPLISVTPSRAAAGVSVTIGGSNFCQQPPVNCSSA